VERKGGKNENTVQKMCKHTSKCKNDIESVVFHEWGKKDKRNGLREEFKMI
jgi:hypothetical protein